MHVALVHYLPYISKIVIYTLQVIMNDVQKAIEDQFRDVDSDNEVPDQIFERVTNVGGRGNIALVFASPCT